MKIHEIIAQLSQLDCNLDVFCIRVNRNGDIILKDINLTPVSMTEDARFNCYVLKDSQNGYTTLKKKNKMSESDKSSYNFILCSDTKCFDYETYFENMHKLKCFNTTFFGGTAD